MAELIVVTCPHCQKQLKAPSDRIGRAAKCPQCQQSFVLGEGAKAGGSASGIAMAAPVSGISTAAPAAAPSAAPPASKPAAPPAAPAAPTKWTLKIPTGDTYGPIERAELDQWFQEGRINAECQLLAEGASGWRWAAEIYPSLGGAHAAPQAPNAAPQIGAAVSAGVTKGWNALGGFVDNVVGQIENNYASPQTTNFQAAPEFSGGPLEIQWQSVVAGLRVTKWSLLLGGVMIAIFGLFSFFISFRDRLSEPGWFVRMILTFVVACAYISVAAFFGNLIGWMVQTEIPVRARTRTLLQLALGCFAVTFLIILLIFQFGLMESFSGFGSFIRTTVQYVLPVIILAGLGIYGCFLHTTNMFFGRRELRNLVMISFGLLAGTYLLYFISSFITNSTVNSILGLLLSLLFAASLGQLGLMSHHLKQVIQAQQAQS